MRGPNSGSKRVPVLPAPGHGTPPPAVLPRPEPVLDVPSEILQRYHARELDPSTAPVVDGAPPVRSTVYIADRLIVAGAPGDTGQPPGLPAGLDAAAAANGLVVATPEAAIRERLRVDGVASVRLEPGKPTADGLPVPVTTDAWRVLQTLRSMHPTAPVSLDHLLTASKVTAGHPFVARDSYEPMSSYGLPGWGGRQPVNWLGPAPSREWPAGKRRPVVAILDTGVRTDAGAHPWLAGVVTELGLPDDPLNPLLTPDQGALANPYTGMLASDTGHATFIAGLIRQTCGPADILSMQIMGGDGIVVESDLLAALRTLVVRQTAASGAGGDAATAIDVLSLSIGYYHEDADDLTYDLPLITPLRDLAALGVLIVCAAGNDATDRPMFPAAFSTLADPGRLAVRLCSVAALNPNDTIALFSNAGTTVTHHRPGAALISTYPRVDAALQPAALVGADESDFRESLDPDDFGSGFAVWSGTSFAAPVLAGELAESICARVDADGTRVPLDIDDVSPSAMLARARAAVSAAAPRPAPRVPGTDHLGHADRHGADPADDPAPSS